MQRPSKEWVVGYYNFTDRQRIELIKRLYDKYASMNFTRIAFIMTGVVVLSALFASCKKSPAICDNPTTALILYRGAPEVDGCGWMVQINGVDYHPLSLAAAYQTDSLKVNVSYAADTSRYYCGDAPVTMPTPVIRINCIERR